MIEKIILSTREFIKYNKIFVNENNEQKTMLKRQFRKIENRRLTRKRCIRYNRKILKQVKGRANMQTKYLAKKLDNKISKIYIGI